jgi:hypothetical protein
MDLKSIIINRLGSVRNLMETADGVSSSTHKLQKDPKTGEVVLPDQRTSIVIQAAIRENLRQLGNDWRQLEALHLSESGRRKQVHTQAESLTRRSILENLEREISEIRRDQREWYIRDMNHGQGGGGSERGSLAGLGGERRVKDIEDCELFVGARREKGISKKNGGASKNGGDYSKLEDGGDHDNDDHRESELLINPEAKAAALRNKQLYPSPLGNDALDVDASIRRVDVNSFFDSTGGWNGDSQGGVGVTAGQREKLLTVRQREEAFVRTIEGIGLGVEDLRELAIQQNEEVKMQNLMLEDMSMRMDEVRDKMEFINKRMKGVLAKMGRGGDKLCIDIICVVLALGLGGILWKGVDSGVF